MNKLLTKAQVNEMARIINTARAVRELAKKDLYEVIYQNFEDIPGFETTSQKVKKYWADQIIRQIKK